MNVRAVIRSLRSMVPGRRWLALAAAVAVAAGVATPLLAQTATITHWSLPASVQDIALDSSDNVWAQTGGTSGLHKLAPATNELTTYTTGGVSHHSAVFAVGTSEVWSPGTISATPSAIEVISRLDLVTLELTSWPLGFQAQDVRVDSLGNVWFTGGSNVGRLEPGTNTVTTWALPVTVGSFDSFDAGDRPFFNYNDTGTGDWGLARLDPGTNALTTWSAATNPDTVQLPFVDGAGNVWAALTHNVGEDSIIRLNPATDTITEWPCRPGCDDLVDVAMDVTGKVWFTEGIPSSGFSRIGRLDPTADPPLFTEWIVPCSAFGVWCFTPPSGAPRALLLDSAGNVWLRFDYPYVSHFIARLTP